MSLRTNIAKITASLSRFVLKKVLRRDGDFFPGKLALKIDPDILRKSSNILNAGSIVITGTNGKTSVTSLIAKCMEFSGYDVVYNISGANLSSGVVAAILNHKASSNKKTIGVFEVDELWVNNVLSNLHSNYLLLLDLFPDQEDRMGGISNIQKRILDALKNSPNTVLVYNADDPNCQLIADSCSNSCISFGLEEKVSKIECLDEISCPICDFNFSYSLHQYAQLGIYRCPNCGFNRAKLDYAANNIDLNIDKLSFDVNGSHYTTDMAVEYFCYNLCGFIAIAKTMSCPDKSINKAINTLNLSDGRIRSFKFGDCNVLINLAKNPVGFNQNINMICDKYFSYKRPVRTAVLFFVNAREGDGKSTNWYYDVKFQDILDMENAMFYIGGEAVDDLNKCLKQKNIHAHKIDSIEEIINSTNKYKNIFIIANYTAWYICKDELVKLSNNS